MDVGVPELILILVIVILLFGVGRIGKVAGELGSGIRAFREGLRGDEEEAEQKVNKTETVKEPTLSKTETVEQDEETISSGNHS